MLVTEFLLYTLAVAIIGAVAAVLHINLARR
jgi:hypothetical protein